MKDKMKHQRLFYTLLQQLQMQVWVSLGKVKNPISMKAETNYALARLSIEIMEMLRDKTEGNRTPEESDILENLLNDLQSHYLKETETTKISENGESAAE
ncbi:MAG: DUF1844 domain-containing protein [Calditrichia bacterium]